MPTAYPLSLPPSRGHERGSKRVSSGWDAPDEVAGRCMACGRLTVVTVCAKCREMEDSVASCEDSIGAGSACDASYGAERELVERTLGDCACCDDCVRWGEDDSA